MISSRRHALFIGGIRQIGLNYHYPQKENVDVETNEYLSMPVTSFLSKRSGSDQSRNTTRTQFRQGQGG